MSIIYRMGNQLECAADFDNLAKRFNATPIGSLDAAGAARLKAFTPGVISNRTGSRELHLMQFSIAPPEWETSAHRTMSHDFVGIEEPTKWPWLTAIETSRCVVPLSSYREKCYWGDTEGTEVDFLRSDQEFLHAAGIYRIWNSPTGNEQLYTMSLLTRPASDYVMDHGSHRQPIFLELAGLDAWMNPQAIPCDKAIEVLRLHSTDPELTHANIRDMPNGWTKKQKGNIRKRGQTMAAQDRCPHACGF